MNLLPTELAGRVARLGLRVAAALVLTACSSPAEPSVEGAAGRRTSPTSQEPVVATSATVASGQSTAGDAPAAPPRRTIADGSAARRLARAIASDILLYNEESVRSARASGVMPEKLAAEIEEGRSLYRQRVTPEHYGLFQPAIDEIVFEKRAVQ